MVMVGLYYIATVVILNESGTMFSWFWYACGYKHKRGAKTTT